MEKRRLRITLLTFLLIALSAYPIFGSYAPAEKDGLKLGNRLQSLDREIEEALSLRMETARKVEEYLYWGGFLGAVNSALTKQEIYQIGKSITNWGKLYGLSPQLITAVIITESSGRPFAVSPKGAVGLMQVMPFWKEKLDIKGDLFSIDTNIMVGCYILSDNIRKWGYKEGILRYYRGGGISDDGYFVKVQNAIGRLAG